MKHGCKYCKYNAYDEHYRGSNICSVYCNHIDPYSEAFCDKFKPRGGCNDKETDNAPIVEERPKGEWKFKEITDDYKVYGQCSICKQRKRIDNFCSNCGAKMYDSIDTPKNKTTTEMIFIRGERKMTDDEMKNLQEHLNEDIKALNWTDSILGTMSAIVVNAYIAGYNRALTDLKETNND